MKLKIKGALLVTICFTTSIWATEWLPALPPWSGASEALVKAKDAAWVTPAEMTGLQDSPDYIATMQYIEHLVASSAWLTLETIGISPQGRPIVMIKASKTLDSMTKQLNKPLLLIQAGIHSGEIDGKDAGLMLLRDIVHGNKAHLLDQADLLFIPILSVDGHERRSRFNRMNQRGPVHQGWRTTALNLNLNRDYSKAEATEMHALLRVINQYQPDLYIDVHVTDGEDYQYDITYGFNEPFAAVSVNTASWLASVYRPAIDQALSTAGHIPGPLIFGVDATDFSKGISGWTASPRYSSGYGDVRHLATVLVENHSLKPYRQRVLGTYVLLEQSLLLLNQQGKALSMARQADMQARPKQMTLSYSANSTPEYIRFKGMSYDIEKSAITGENYVKWTGQAKTYEQLPLYWDNVPKQQVFIPTAYWLPAEYQHIVDKLRLHGIEVTKTDKPLTLTIQQLDLSAFKFATQPFEGRFMLQQAEFSRHEITRTLAKGWYRVSTDQELGRLAVALLEPTAPDSLFNWGFFSAMFERTEYFEPYAIEPLIQAMLVEQPELKQQFEKALQQDAQLAASPRERYNWFYRRMAFYDEQYLKYPVLIQH